MRHLLIALFALLLATDSLAAPQEILPVRADEIVVGWDAEPFADVMPELIYRVPPEYPQIARKARVHGTVTVQMLVDTNGIVVNTHITSSVPMLDAAALECVRQWQFKPAMSYGRPVRVSIAALVQFNLRAKREKHPGPPPLRVPGHQDERPQLPDGELLRPAEWPAGWKRGERGVLLAEQIDLDRLPEVTEVRPANKASGWSPYRHPGYASYELVVALVRVERDGRVSAARIVSSAPGCDSGALFSVRLWRFRPARRQGKSVPVSLYVPVMVRTQ